MLLKCGKVKMNVETSSYFWLWWVHVKQQRPGKWHAKNWGIPGQKVWLSTRDIPLGLPSRKLVPRFVGPYEIDTIISPAPVWLKLPASWRTPPRFHISQFKPDGGGSIWWTGRVMVRRSVPGFHSHLFWIPVWSPIFTLLSAGSGLDGHQEATLEGRGVAVMVHGSRWGFFAFCYQDGSIATLLDGATCVAPDPYPLSVTAGLIPSLFTHLLW